MKGTDVRTSKSVEGWWPSDPCLAPPLIDTVTVDTTRNMAKLECQTLCSAAILRSGSFWSAFWGLFPLPIGCAAAFGAE